MEYNDFEPGRDYSPDTDAGMREIFFEIPVGATGGLTRRIVITDPSVTAAEVARLIRHTDDGRSDIHDLRRESGTVWRFDAHDNRVTVATWTTDLVQPLHVSCDDRIRMHGASSVDNKTVFL